LREQCAPLHSGVLEHAWYIAIALTSPLSGILAASIAYSPHENDTDLYEMEYLVKQSFFTWEPLRGGTEPHWISRRAWEPSIKNSGATNRSQTNYSYPEEPFQWSQYRTGSQSFLPLEP